MSGRRRVRISNPQQDHSPWWKDWILYSIPIVGPGWELRDGIEEILNDNPNGELHVLFGLLGLVLDVVAAASVAGVGAIFTRLGVSVVEHTGGTIANKLAKRVFIDLAENASEDILRNVASSLASMGLRDIDSGTIRLLFCYIGQGNVREIRNIIRRFWNSEAAEAERKAAIKFLTGK